MTKMAEASHRKKTTIPLIKAALAANNGIISRAAKSLGIARQVLHERINKTEALKLWQAHIDEVLSDTAETVIHKAIKKNDVSTARWYLERKGRRRGYGLRTDVRMSDEEIEGLIASFGGDIEKLRAFRRRLSGPAPSSVKQITDQRSG